LSHCLDGQTLRDIASVNLRGAMRGRLESSQDCDVVLRVEGSDLGAVFVDLFAL
jgi:hypothetical protein